MNRWTTFLTFCGVLGLSWASWAQAPTTVGVFDVSIAGLDDGVRQPAIDAIATSAAATGSFKVLTKNEINALLGAERLKDSLGCDDVTCMAELGAAAGVEKLIGGSIAKVDAALVVSLQLVNVRYATVENRVTLEWPGSPGKLAEVLGAATELLVIPVKERKAGAIQVAGVPTDAAISIDGQPRGLGPITIDGQSVGVHMVRIEAPDFEPHQEPVIVRSGATTRVDTSLVARAPTPFYARWWFWPAAVAVVGGGVAAAVLAGGGANEDANASGTFTLPAVGALRQSAP